MPTNVLAGQDAILFASVAVCVACLAQGRFSNSIILLAGELVQACHWEFSTVVTGSVSGMGPWHL